METLAERWERWPGLQRVDATGAAALTFDDGPDPEGTPAILDALDAAGARATFFLVAEQLVRDHELAREAAARGHELALHCFAHRDHNVLPPGEARDDLERGMWAFQAVLDATPRWYRPPFGHISEESYAAVRELGLELVYWSALGQDWLPIAGAEIAANVVSDLTDGAIVLLHDSARLAERPAVSPTAMAVELLADAAVTRGIELCTLGALADRP